MFSAIFLRLLTFISYLFRMSYRKRTKLDTTVFYAVGLSFKFGYSPFFLEKPLDSYDGFLPSAVKASFAFFA